MDAFQYQQQQQQQQYAYQYNQAPPQQRAGSRCTWGPSPETLWNRRNLHCTLRTRGSPSLGYCEIFFGRKTEFAFTDSENREENRGENREESACGALLRALHAPGGADEERIARGCPASMCTAP